MMTSVYVISEGYFEYEAAHGTVQNITTVISREKKLPRLPLQRSLHGQVLSEGELDGNAALADFAGKTGKSILTLSKAEK